MAEENGATTEGIEGVLASLPERIASIEAVTKMIADNLNRLAQRKSGQTDD